MAYAKLLVDSNVIVDFVARREPFYDDARMLMLAGKVGELSLWMSSSQVTDVLYVLTQGGKQKLVPSAQKAMQSLTSFVHVYAVDAEDIQAMLGGDWVDPEDELLHVLALKMQADAIITRNAADFEKSLIPVHDCAEFFHWLEEKFGVTYEEVGI